MELEEGRTVAFVVAIVVHRADSDARGARVLSTLIGRSSTVIQTTRLAVVISIAVVSQEKFIHNHSINTVVLRGTINTHRSWKNETDIRSIGIDRRAR